MALETTVTAIVIRAEDYRETDKRLTVLSPDNGLVFCVLRGVKKAGAKLRFAAEPFVLADFTYVSRGNVVVGVDLIEDLHWVTEDYDRYVVGSVMLDAAAAVATSGDSSTFTALLAAIKQLLSQPPIDVLCAFLSHLAEIHGLGGFAALSPASAVRKFEAAFDCRLKSAILL